MRKTIELTDEHIKAVTEYQKRNGLKNFSEAVRGIISTMPIIGYDIDQIKMDILNTHIAPESAGEVG